MELEMKWLDCTISMGQFTGEFAVQGKLFDNTEFSLFAERENLKFVEEPEQDKSVDGYIRVITGPQKDDLLLVALPQPTFGNGQTVTVKINQVSDL